MQTIVSPSESKTADTFPINGTDHIEFYVGNAKQSAMYYQAAFGYEIVAYRGPETGSRDVVSYVLKQDKIMLVLTSTLDPNHEIAKHVAFHGDGVKVLALWVDDSEAAYRAAMAKGAESAFEPHTIEDEFGKVTLSAIKTYGETIHTLVERNDYKGAFMPGFIARKSERPVTSTGLKHVDHCVGNVELGDMNKWVKFFGSIGIFITPHI